MKKRQKKPVTLRDSSRYAPLLAIRNAREYDRAFAHLNQLVDEVGDNPRNPRYRFIDTLSLLVEAYDQVRYPV